MILTTYLTTIAYDIRHFKARRTFFLTHVTLRAQLFFFFLIYLLFHVVFYESAIAKYMILYTIGLVLVLKRVFGRRISWPTSFIVAQAAVLVLFFPTPIYKYISLNYDRIQKEVLKQPGVKSLVVPRLHERQVLFPWNESVQISYSNPYDFFGPYQIESFGNDLVFVSDEKTGTIEKLDLLTGRRQVLTGDVTFFSINPGTDSGFSGSSWLATDDSEMFEFSLSDMVIKKKYPLAPHIPHRPNWAQDGFRFVTVIDEDKYILTQHSRLIRLGNGLENRAEMTLHWLCIANNMIYLSSLDELFLPVLPFYLQSVDLKTFTGKQRKVIPGCVWVEQGPAPDEIVANDFWAIQVIDGKTMKTKKRIKTKGSIRMFEVDPGRGVVYVIHYSSGKVAAYSLNDGKPLGDVKVGMLPRAIHYHKERDRIYVGSLSGVFIINPNVLFQHP